MIIENIHSEIGSSDNLKREIDTIHLSANNALRNKNFEWYAQHFSNDLKYKQLDGRTIDKKKLISDIAVYFDRILKFSFIQNTNETTGNTNVKPMTGNHNISKNAPTTAY